jgi:hypothetical protein
LINKVWKRYHIQWALAFYQEDKMRTTEVKNIACQLKNVCRRVHDISQNIARASFPSLFIKGPTLGRIDTILECYQMLRVECLGRCKSEMFNYIHGTHLYRRSKVYDENSFVVVWWSLVLTLTDGETFFRLKCVPGGGYKQTYITQKAY